MVNDHISDLITQIKNAGNAGKDTLTVSATNMKEAILGALVRAGFIKSFEKKGKKAVKLEIMLMKQDGGPRIQGVERVSKLSKRLYSKVADLQPIRNGFGALIISTPNGVLTDREAKKQNVGGEPLFKIW